MTAKQYLEQYGSLEAEKQNLQQEKQMILVDIALPGSIDYSADRVQSSPSDRMPNLVIKLQKRQKYIDNRLVKIFQIQTEIKDNINALEYKTYKTLLWKKYIEDKDWDKVAMEMHYWSEESGSVYTRGKLHSKALDAMQKRLQKVTSKRAKM